MYTPPLEGKNPQPCFAPVLASDLVRSGIHERSQKHYVQKISTILDKPV